MQRIQKKNKKRVNVMILGVGTDLVEIDRMRKACEKEHFVSRTFTEAGKPGKQEGLPLSLPALLL